MSSAFPAGPRFAAFVLLSFLAGCSTIDSGAHFDETTDFSAWETWPRSAAYRGVDDDF